MIDAKEPANAPIWHQLYQHRSEPAVRAVLGDWLEENGRVGLGWLKRVAERNAAADAGDDDDDADASADADAVVADASADAADDAVDEDTSASATDAAETALTDIEADDAASIAEPDGDDDSVANTRRFWRVEDMREGLLLIQVPGRYWGVTRVGWARRVEGDEWEFVGVTVTRTGAVRTLASLAAEGPGQDHVVTPMDEVTELLHRFSPRRVLVANPKKWGKYCPKPEGW